MFLCVAFCRFFLVETWKTSRWLEFDWIQSRILISLLSFGTLEMQIFFSFEGDHNTFGSSIDHGLGHSITMKAEWHQLRLFKNESYRISCQLFNVTRTEPHLRLSFFVCRIAMHSNVYILVLVWTKYQQQIAAAVSGRKIIIYTVVNFIRLTDEMRLLRVWNDLELTELELQSCWRLLKTTKWRIC